MHSFNTQLFNLIDRIQPSQTMVRVITAILVGLGTGIGAVLFIELIELVGRTFFSISDRFFSTPNRVLFIIIPAIGGLLAGPIIAYFASEAKGHGVPEVMQAIALRGGEIRPRVVVAKIVSSALCIGSGGSAGREGPIVQVGAALGSSLGQWLRLSEARIRNLVACGAAAGISATFNAPIAGVIFSMEVILGEFYLADLGNVIISSVVAATFARVFLGDQVAFAIPRYGMKSPWEVMLYALLGMLAALVAIGFIRMLYWFEDRFDEWKAPGAIKPAIGGLLLGILGFAYPIFLVSSGLTSAEEAHLGTPLIANIPHVFSSGFETIEQALLGELPLVLLLSLVLLKPLATSLTLGSGNSGGVFAPSLFLGAALGGAFGQAIEMIAPGVTAGPGAFATVGMAAVFAGAARAPFTAILIVFEMTDDYRLIVPLMAAVIVSMLLAERLHPESIYTLKLTRRGIHLKRGQDVDVMEAVRVDEVMLQPASAIPANLPVTRLADEFIQTGRHGFPVVDEMDHLIGVVSLEDYRRALATRPEAVENLTVRNIVTRNPVTVYPDESVGSAMRRMAPRDLSRLPVVSRDDPRKLIGLVRRNDIVRAYDFGVVRREEARRRAETSRGVAAEEARFVDVSLSENASGVGKIIADLRLPRAAVLVSIRRANKLIIPHGDTRLEAGDVVTALCEESSIPEFKEALTSPIEPGSPPEPTD